MTQVTEQYFELLEAVAMITLFLIVAPILTLYWSKQLVTTAYEKTALDAKGTIVEAEYKDFKISNALLMCYIAEDNYEGKVVVDIDGAVGREVVIEPKAEEDWLSVRKQKARSVWSNASTWGKVTSDMLGLPDGYKYTLKLRNLSAEYVPETIENIGSDTVVKRGYWLYKFRIP